MKQACVSVPLPNDDKIAPSHRMNFEQVSFPNFHLPRSLFLCGDVMTQLSKSERERGGAAGRDTSPHIPAQSDRKLIYDTQKPVLPTTQIGNVGELWERFKYVQTHESPWSPVARLSCKYNLVVCRKPCKTPLTKHLRWSQGTESIASSGAR